MLNLRRRGARGLWLLVFCLGCHSVSADITIRSVETRYKDKVYLLDANIDYQLSEASIDALKNGVPLILLLDIQVEKQRSWWWNKTVANLEQGYLLLYHALTENYLVTNLNSSAQNNYRSLDSALEVLRHIQALPIVDEKLLEADARYSVRVRMHLDIEALPAPMRPFAYLSSDWRLESDWYTWPLQR
ncbi:MAG: DUF4390 domain-containing protein [Gammaproteobacteria bacterium]